MVVETITERIRQLSGPILILGASGFVGGNLMRTIAAVRDDVHGTTIRLPAWRLRDLPQDQVHVVDLLIDSNLEHLLDRVKPKVVFNCVAFGAYSFETDTQLIYQTNFSLTTRLVERLATRNIACYVHAGSSSEYGNNAAGPDESAPLEPNSPYAVSKAAAAHLLWYFGRHRSFPCANLRLYSVYGPWEDSSRLIPNLICRGLAGKFPEFVHPEISRDFIYVDDVVSAFVAAALQLHPADYGRSFNIGTGKKTTISDLARLSAKIFHIAEAPQFTMPVRSWDVTDWYGRIDQARERLQWQPQVSLEDGLRQTADWMRMLPDLNEYERTSKKYGLNF